VLVPPDVLTATIQPEQHETVGRGAVFTAHLTTTRSDGVLASLRPTAGAAAARVEPVAVRVMPGEPATATVTVRARTPALLRPAHHRVELVWETDVRDGTARGVAHADLLQRPPVPPLLTVVLVAVLAAAVLVALRPLWQGSSLGGLPVARPSAESGQDGSGTAPPVGGEQVRAPYAQLRSVLEQPDPAQARADAEALVEQWNARGLGVRLVDGTALPEQTSRSGDFLVVVRDGFRDLAEVQEFCRDHAGLVGTCVPVA
jgi:hypothetical protein